MNFYDKMIAVTNRHICKVDFLEQIKKICTLKPKALVLREKDLNESDYENLAYEVMKICENHKIQFIAHNFINAARNLNCKNIHLPLSKLRSESVSDFEIIGASCHSVDDVLEAEKLGAKYVFLGNIYETDCKKGLKGKGLDLLRETCNVSSIPVYAIGGVNLEKMSEILKTGASGGCMMSGFMN